MKSLFLTFRPLYIESGISKKVISQYNSLRKVGLDVSFCKMVIEEDGSYNYAINKDVVCHLGKGFRSKISLFTKYKGIAAYVARENIKFVYIRYILNATPFFLSFLNSLKKSGAVIFMEIPTYPYDKELRGNWVQRVQSFMEKRCRVFFYKYVDRIVTYTDLKRIYKIPCVNISNGVDINSIPLRTPKPHSGFMMVGVAQLEEWHGFDRIIRGISDYYKNGGTMPLDFYIVGNGDKCIQKYQTLANDLSVTEHIHIEGKKSGKGLDEYFDKADIAIGCLACHRKNVVKVKSLKNVEYASRGIPFIYSEINTDFDNQKYVLKETPDDSLIDIKRIIQFVNQLGMSPGEIRDTIKDRLTWDAQMLIVSKALKEVLDEKN